MVTGGTELDPLVHISFALVEEMLVKECTMRSVQKCNEKFSFSSYSWSN